MKSPEEQIADAVRKYVGLKRDIDRHQSEMAEEIRTILAELGSPNHVEYDDRVNRVVEPHMNAVERNRADMEYELQVFEAFADGENPLEWRLANPKP